MYKTVLLLALVASALAQAGDEDIQAQQAELSMKRTACLVLSRYHSNTQKDAIESVISELQPEQQQKYINKMYAMAIEHCLPTVTMDEAQKVFVSFMFSSLWRILASIPKRCSIFSITSTTQQSSMTSTPSQKIKKP